MTEEQKDQLDAEAEAPAAEEAALEGAVQAEVTPAEEKKKGWPVVVAVIAAILAMCVVVVCIAAAIAALSGGGDEASVATDVPAAPEPGRAMIAISEPDQGEVVDIAKPVRV